MKPFRIQVDRLIDFGAIVTLIGVDAETSKPVTFMSTTGRSTWFGPLGGISGPNSRSNTPQKG
jgi:hypothetical protein